MILRFILAVFIAFGGSIFGAEKKENLSEKDIAVLKLVASYVQENVSIILPTLTEGSYHYLDVLRDSSNNISHVIGAIHQKDSVHGLLFSIGRKWFSSTAIVKLLYITSDKRGVLDPVLFNDIKKIVLIFPEFPKNLFDSYVLIEELEDPNPSSTSIWQKWTFFNKTEKFAVDVCLIQDPKGRYFFKIKFPKNKALRP